MLGSSTGSVRSPGGRSMASAGRSHRYDLPSALLRTSVVRCPLSMSNRVDRKCPVCGAVYVADANRLRHGRQTTCSRKCSYELRSARRRKAKVYRCAVCSNAVTRSPSQVKSRFVFCSRDCHYQARGLGLVERNVVKPYKVTAAGLAAWRAAAEARRGVPRKDPVRWTCEVCGRARTINRGHLAPARKLRFCSHKCAARGLAGAGNPAWRGGHPGYYGPNWRAVRRAARAADHDTCQRCLIHRDAIGQELDVHHIRPVSSFKNANDANFIENTVTLCHPCHMLVEWNGIDFELPKRCTTALVVDGD